MSQRNFPQYGPIQRRRSQTESPRRPRPMATPIYDESYTGATIPMRVAPRKQSVAPPPVQRSGSGWWWKVPLLLVVLLIGAAFAGLAWIDRKYADRIYPNVAIQGVNLSETTKDEAAQKVQQTFAAFFKQPITITYQGQTWKPSPADLGVKADVQREIDRAYNFGRGNGLVNNVLQVSEIYQEGRDLPLRISIDAQKLKSYLERVAADIERPAREAEVRIVDARVEATESATGRMVLIDQTIADVERAIRSLKPQAVTLRTAELKPQLTSESIAEAKRTIEAMLASPIQLAFNDKTFELDQATLAGMINVQRVEGETTTLNAQLDQAKLKKWVTKLADKIGRASVEPRVSWNGGNLQIFQEGKTGYRLNIDYTVEMVNGAVATVTRKLDLPVEEVQPRVTPETLASLGIKELVSIGKSDFAGSAPYRVTNIKAGARIINGILLAPGEEFSFNKNVGEINEANGFVEGYAIIGNRTQLEWGGGICQVSTTVFRAAFYAGLPFTEKNPHRFRISWYEKYDPIGMDAAIFTGGGPDLRFVNDTGNWLLIQSSVDDATSTLTYAIYGTKVPGRTVERSEPLISNQVPAPTEALWFDDPELPVGEIKQTDTARGGMDIKIVRYVKQDGVVVSTNEFITKFQAWPNIYTKNPKTPKPAQP